MSAEQVECILFVDYPQYRNVADCLIRFNFKELKRVISYNRIRRPWVMNRLNQFGTEKRIVILQNSRGLKKFLTALQTKKAV